MKFLDYIRYGLKNIWRQKARTILTIIAVVIGATSVVLMLTIIFGAKQAAINQLQSAGVFNQVTVSGSSDISTDNVFSGGNGGGQSATSIKLTDAVLAKVAAIPHVADAYPQVGVYNLQSSAITDSSGKKITLDQAQFVAYPPTAARDRSLSAGRNLTSNDVYDLVIGQDTLDALGYKGNDAAAIGKTLQFGVQGYVGDDTNLPTPPFQNGPGNNDAQQQYQQLIQKHVGIETATIVGVMTAGPFDQEDFVPMAWAKKVFTMNQLQQVQQPPVDCAHTQCSPNQPQQQPKYTLVQQSQLDQQGYSTFVANVDDLSNVNGVATAIKALGLGAATAQSVIDQIEQTFKLVSIVFGAISGISLMVAAIGVINTMVMATLERTREIGVLRACGATRSAVRRLFTFEAALLGFWGGVIGCAIAYGIIAGVLKFGGSALSKQGVPLSVLSIPLWLALATVAATTVIGLLAGYGPALRAARLDPVEALRYE